MVALDEKIELQQKKLQNFWTEYLEACVQIYKMDDFLENWICAFPSMLHSEAGLSYEVYNLGFSNTVHSFLEPIELYTLFQGDHETFIVPAGFVLRLTKCYEYLQVN